MQILESPSPKDALCQDWLKWPSGSGEEDENVKSLRNDNDKNDEDGQRTDCDHKKLTRASGSCELKMVPNPISHRGACCAICIIVFVVWLFVV